MDVNSNCVVANMGGQIKHKDSGIEQVTTGCSYGENEGLTTAAPSGPSSPAKDYNGTILKDSEKSTGLNRMNVCMPKSLNGNDESSLNKCSQGSDNCACISMDGKVNEKVFKKKDKQKLRNDQNKNLVKVGKYERADRIVRKSVGDDENSKMKNINGTEEVTRNSNVVVDRSIQQHPHNKWTKAKNISENFYLRSSGGKGRNISDTNIQKKWAAADMNKIGVRSRDSPQETREGRRFSADISTKVTTKVNHNEKLSVAGNINGNVLESFCLQSVTATEASCLTEGTRFITTDCSTDCRVADSTTVRGTDNTSAVLSAVPCVETSKVVPDDEKTPHESVQLKSYSVEDSGVKDSTDGKSVSEMCKIEVKCTTLPEHIPENVSPYEEGEVPDDIKPKSYSISDLLGVRAMNIPGAPSTENNFQNNFQSHVIDGLSSNPLTAINHNMVGTSPVYVPKELRHLVLIPSDKGGTASRVPYRSDTCEFKAPRRTNSRFELGGNKGPYSRPFQTVPIEHRGIIGPPPGLEKVTDCPSKAEVAAIAEAAVEAAKQREVDHAKGRELDPSAPEFRPKVLTPSEHVILRTYQDRVIDMCEKLSRMSKTILLNDIPSRYLTEFGEHLDFYGVGFDSLYMFVESLKPSLKLVLSEDVGIIAPPSNESDTNEYQSNTKATLDEKRVATPEGTDTARTPKVQPRSPTSRGGARTYIVVFVCSAVMPQLRLFRSMLIRLVADSTSYDPFLRPENTRADTGLSLTVVPQEWRRIYGSSYDIRFFLDFFHVNRLQSILDSMTELQVVTTATDVRVRVTPRTPVPSIASCIGEVNYIVSREQSMYSKAVTNDPSSVRSPVKNYANSSLVIPPPPPTPPSLCFVGLFSVFERQMSQIYALGNGNGISANFAALKEKIHAGGSALTKANSFSSDTVPCPVPRYGSRTPTSSQSGALCYSNSFSNDQNCGVQNCRSSNGFFEIRDQLQTGVGVSDRSRGAVRNAGYVGRSEKSPSLAVGRDEAAHYSVPTEGQGYRRTDGMFNADGNFHSWKLDDKSSNNIPVKHQGLLDPPDPSSAPILRGTGGSSNFGPNSQSFHSDLLMGSVKSNFGKNQEEFTYLMKLLLKAFEAEGLKIDPFLTPAGVGVLAQFARHLIKQSMTYKSNNEYKDDNNGLSYDNNELNNADKQFRPNCNNGQNNPYRSSQPLFTNNDQTVNGVFNGGGAQSDAMFNQNNFVDLKKCNERRFNENFNDGVCSPTHSIDILMPSSPMNYSLNKLGDWSSSSSQSMRFADSGCRIKNSLKETRYSIDNSASDHHVLPSNNYNRSRNFSVSSNAIDSTGYMRNSASQGYLPEGILNSSAEPEKQDYMQYINGSPTGTCPTIYSKPLISGKNEKKLDSSQGFTNNEGDLHSLFQLLSNYCRIDYASLSNVLSRVSEGNIDPSQRDFLSRLCAVLRVPPNTRSDGYMASKNTDNHPDTQKKNKIDGDNKLSAGLSSSSPSRSNKLSLVGFQRMVYELIVLSAEKVASDKNENRENNELTNPEQVSSTTTTGEIKADSITESNQSDVSQRVVSTECNSVNNSVIDSVLSVIGIDISKLSLSWVKRYGDMFLLSFYMKYFSIPSFVALVQAVPNLVIIKKINDESFARVTTNDILRTSLAGLPLPTQKFSEVFSLSFSNHSSLPFFQFGYYQNRSNEPPHVPYDLLLFFKFLQSHYRTPPANENRRLDAAVHAYLTYIIERYVHCYEANEEDKLKRNDSFEEDSQKKGKASDLSYENLSKTTELSDCPSENQLQSVFRKSLFNIVLTACRCQYVGFSKSKNSDVPKSRTEQRLESFLLQADLNPLDNKASVNKDTDEFAQADVAFLAEYGITGIPQVELAGQWKQMYNSDFSYFVSGLQNIEEIIKGMGCLHLVESGGQPVLIVSLKGWRDDGLCYSKPNNDEFQTSSPDISDAVRTIQQASRAQANAMSILTNAFLMKKGNDKNFDESLLLSLVGQVNQSMKDISTIGDFLKSGIAVPGNSEVNQVGTNDNKERNIHKLNNSGYLLKNGKCQSTESVNNASLPFLNGSNDSVPKVLPFDSGHNDIQDSIQRNFKKNSEVNVTEVNEVRGSSSSADFHSSKQPFYLSDQLISRFKQQIEIEQQGDQTGNTELPYRAMEDKVFNSGDCLNKDFQKMVSNYECNPSNEYMSNVPSQQYIDQFGDQCGFWKHYANNSGRNNFNVQSNLGFSNNSDIINGTNNINTNKFLYSNNKNIVPTIFSTNIVPGFHNNVLNSNEYNSNQAPLYKNKSVARNKKGFPPTNNFIPNNLINYTPNNFTQNNLSAVNGLNLSANQFQPKPHQNISFTGKAPVITTIGRIPNVVSQSPMNVPPPPPPPANWKNFIRQSDDVSDYQQFISNGSVENNPFESTGGGDNPSVFTASEISHIKNLLVQKFNQQNAAAKRPVFHQFETLQ